MLGSGILAFPSALSKDGWVAFAAMWLGFSCAIFGGSALLLEVGHAKGILNYSELTAHIFGDSASSFIKVSARV